MYDTKTFYCMDCGSELTGRVDWEPVMQIINGERVHGAQCVPCIDDVAKTQDARITEDCVPLMPSDVPSPAYSTFATWSWEYSGETEHEFV